ncbi:energy transducer TonB [Maribacter arenosus]|uniref:Energy transducer TonB n=1 Tax=Maribacter arenosus TaxID=1854708 RepID=A0ABR7VJC8_9FLAO|nr:energy transducer TonB [Maribacter arenosus]MBD0852257.1 energy transducer TonB [Maribacter arenosus]
MKPKKYPKKDLNKNSGLYFVIGLILVMVLTYVAFEWKSYEKPDQYTERMNRPDDNLIEELPPMIIFKTPPPPLMITPSILEIIPDEEDKPETDFDVIEPDQETEIIEIDDIPDVEVEPEINVNWISIEEVPVFPGCEDEKDKRACFQKMMNKHINKVFRYPEIAQDMGIEGKVYTQFTIQEDGNIGGILLRGPDNILENEAERIINKLPKMTPGKQRDRNVKVAFTIPINFKLH